MKDFNNDGFIDIQPNNRFNSQNNKKVLKKLKMIRLNLASLLFLIQKKSI